MTHRLTVLILLFIYGLLPYAAAQEVCNQPLTVALEGSPTGFPVEISQADAGADQEICAAFTASLSAITPDIGTGAWEFVEGPGNVTFGNAVSPSTAITVDAYGSYTLSWVVTVGSCKLEDYVIVHFYQDVEPANAGPDRDVCQTFITSLDAVAPSAGSGKWTLLSGPGMIIFDDDTQPNTGITASEYGVYTFQWTVTYGPCTSSDLITLDFCTPALALTKQIVSGDGYIQEGDLIMYSYTITNTGKFTLSGPFTVYDDKIPGIPSHMGALAPNESVTIYAEYTVVTADLVAGTVTNTAYVSSDYMGYEVVSTAVSATATVNAADLSLTLEADNMFPNVGSIVNFTATIFNDGPNDATNVTAQIFIENGFGDVGNINPSTGIFDPIGFRDNNGSRSMRMAKPNIKWTMIMIPVGTSVQLKFSARVMPPEPGVSYMNMAVIMNSGQYDPNSNPGDDNVMEDDMDMLEIFPPVSDIAAVIRQVDINALPGLPHPDPEGALVPVVPSAINAGEIVCYQLQILNNGPDKAMNVQVNTTPDADMSDLYYSIDYGSTWQPWPIDNTFLIDEFTKTQGVISILLRGMVQSGATGTMELSLFAGSMETYEPDGTNNSTSITTTLTQAADLVITKEQLEPQLLPGGPVAYKITVENTGPSDAKDVVITDIIDPAVISNVTYSLNGGNFVAGWTGSVMVPTLVAGDTYTIEIRGTIIDKTPLANVNPLINTASVATITADPVSENNSVTIESMLTEQADLSIEKTGPATAVSGEMVEYTLLVRNLGNTFTANDVVITDVVDPLIYEDVQYSYDDRNTWLDWYGATAPVQMAPMTERTYYVRAKIRSNVVQNTLTNTAQVSAATTDLDETNNTSQWTLALQQRFDLEVSKTLVTKPEWLVAGGSIEYLINYTNNGPSDAVNVTVSNTIPNGLVGPVTFTTCTNGTPAPWTGSLTLPVIPAGESCFIHIRAGIDANYGGILTVVASIQNGGTDEVPENNVSNADYFIYQPSISMTKTADKKVDVKRGELVTYTYVVTNNGNAPVSGLSLNDVHSGAGTLSNIQPAVVDVLAPGATVTFTATYTITLEDVLAEADIVNTATATSVYENWTYTATATETVDVENFLSIGNKVWHDINGDGQQGAAEPGLSGVEVQLYTAQGAYVDSRTTNAQGIYQFDQVSYGSYYLLFAPPAGYQPTFAHKGNPASDSDVNGAKGPNTTAVFTVVSGVSDLSIDAGYYKCVPIGDLVWYDIDQDDLWDTNENGINEIDVKLWRFDNNQWLLWSTKKTAKKPGSQSDDGYFNFCAPPGKYYIQVIMPPQGLVRARPNVGNNEEIDSDLTNANGIATTDTFTVISGNVKNNIDFGFYPMAVAGNLVWVDENLNGIQEASEPRMEGVKVEAIEAATGNVVNTIYTDEQGTYQLDYLEKQTYYLKFYPPTGYGATLPNATNDASDSDVDHTYGPNTTAAVAFQPGMTNNNIDMGLSFGILPVDWLDVNVVRENKTHIVMWKTAREVNVSHYIVERKMEEDAFFVPIGEWVKAVGNSTSVVDYDFTDKDVSAVGTYVYRIKQVDFDGQYTYSRMFKISHNGDILVDLYPNPSRNDLSIQVVLPYDAEVGIELYDAASKLVRVLRQRDLQKEGDNVYRIDLSGIAPGSYNVMVSIDGEITQKKLIKVE